MSLTQPSEPRKPLKELKIMAEEILQAVLMLIIAGSFGWLIGIALGTAAFGNSKIVHVKRKGRPNA